MREQADVPLAGLTTLRLGGPARRLVVAETDAEVVDTVRDCDARGEPLLVLGGGSNLVVADEGFDGTVLQVATNGWSAALESPDPWVQLRAGVEWDQAVQHAVDEGLAGIEALSGIPGRVGAAPIQNIGAYGQELAHAVDAVFVLDRTTHETDLLPPKLCGFAYRDSVFKHTDRYVVLAVKLRLERSTLSTPVRYAELARALGVDVGDRAPVVDVRAAVLDLRRRKGMVLDPDDHDTWSAGSFFTNPVLTAEDAARLPDGAPRWPERDGRVKTSAAWLIEHAGFSKGYGEGRARVSGKHTLALTNRGDATTGELLALAREIRDGVRSVFGVDLVNEPVLVGAAL